MGLSLFLAVLLIVVYMITADLWFSISQIETTVKNKLEARVYYNSEEGFPLMQSVTVEYLNNTKVYFGVPFLAYALKKRGVVEIQDVA